VSEQIGDNALIDLTGIPLADLMSSEYRSALSTALDHILSDSTIPAASFTAII
jgi:hypothetical protein